MIVTGSSYKKLEKISISGCRAIGRDSSASQHATSPEKGLSSIDYTVKTVCQQELVTALANSHLMSLSVNPFLETYDTASAKEAFSSRLGFWCTVHTISNSQPGYCQILDDVRRPT